MTRTRLLLAVVPLMLSCSGGDESTRATVLLSGPQLSFQTSGVDPALLALVNLDVTITRAEETDPTVVQSIGVGDTLDVSLTTGDWIFEVVVTSSRALDGDRLPVPLLVASQRETLGPGTNPITISNFTEGYNDLDGENAWSEYLNGRDPFVSGPGAAVPIIIPETNATITPASVIRAKFFRPMNPGTESFSGSLLTGAAGVYTWIAGDRTLEIRPSTVWPTGASQTYSLTVSDAAGPSTEATGTYTVENPAATAIPADGNVIGGADEVELTFGENMSTSLATVEVSGSIVEVAMPPTLTWDDAVTLRVTPPAAGWPDSAGDPVSLAVDAETALGEAVRVVFSYVVDGMGPALFTSSSGEGSTIPPRTPILLQFAESVANPMVGAGHTLGTVGTIVTAGGSDVLVEPMDAWNPAGGRLEVSLSDSFGNVSTVGLNFGVANEVFVLEGATGGGAESDPSGSINGALSSCIADPLDPCLVRIAAGTYQENLVLLDANAHFDGGYDPTDWSTRDSQTFTSTLVGTGENSTATLDGANSQVELDGLTILGSSTASDAIAVSILGGVNLIENCVISGGGNASSATSTAIVLPGPNNVLNEIRASTLMGGAGLESFGVVVLPPSNGAELLISNNLIGDTFTMTGVVASGDVNVLHNTILSGSTLAARAVRIDEDGPSIVNNIMMAIGLDLACAEGDSTQQRRPTSFHNNALLGCDTFYIEGGVPLMNLTDSIQLVDSSMQSLGNELFNVDSTVPLNDFFVDEVAYSSSPGEFATRDLHLDCLAVGTISVCEGGTTNPSVNTQIPSTDKDGNLRDPTAPSLGAYEETP